MHSGFSQALSRAVSNNNPGPGEWLCGGLFCLQQPVYYFIWISLVPLADQEVPFKLEFSQSAWEQKEPSGEPQLELPDMGCLTCRQQQRALHSSFHNNRAHNNPLSFEQLSRNCSY